MSAVQALASPMAEYMIIELIRTGVKGEGTFGELHANGKFFCFTMERLWKNNAKGDSCVPIGEYDLVPHNSKKYGNTVALVNPSLNVYHWEEEIPKGQKGRSTVLIHSANWPRQLLGCIAVGQKIMEFPKEGWGVSNSRTMMQELKLLLGDRNGHKLRIS